MQVESFLQQSARRFPDKVALIASSGRFTYSELDRRTNRLAHALRAEGVGRGDRVAVFLENSVEAVIAIFAALKLGGVFVVVNPTTKADKLAYILNDCAVSALVTHQKLSGVYAGMEGHVPSLRAVLVVTDGAGASARRGGKIRLWSDVFRGPAGGENGPVSNPSIDIDLATVIYTSGSTGFPKGVMMTHLNVVTAATSITTYLENTSDDIMLSVLPISFDYGLYQVLMAFKMGATLVLEKSFAYPAAVLERLAQEKVTGFPIIPTMVAILLQMGGMDQERLPHLRYMTNTAAALPAAHIRKLRERFPRTRLYSMYGLTECKRVAYLPPELLDAHPTSVGIAIPNSEVFVVDERGEEVGPGIVGELVIRGAHVMQGYWGKPEETARVLKPGRGPWERFLYSGDLFRRDEHGLLYFVGRKDDIIKTRGEKVSPVEVEAVLYRLAGVQDAAVIGADDEILGQAIKAVIVPAPGATLTKQDVLRHCAAHLESFMIPKHVEFRDSLPKTATGKVSKRGIRADTKGPVE